MQSVGAVGVHEFVPTEFTMVVVPRFTWTSVRVRPEGNSIKTRVRVTPSSLQIADVISVIPAPLFKARWQPKPGYWFGCVRSR
jgi:hypothetical protein